MSVPSIIVLAFLLAVYSAQVIPTIKRDARNALPEYIEDFQLPMGPTLSKGTLEEVYLVVIFYIPLVIIYAVFLGSLIAQLRGPILASTSMLPAVVRYHTGKFFGAVERRTSLGLLPFPVAVLIQNSRPKATCRPNHLPFRRIWTAPSPRGLARLDHSLDLFCRYNRGRGKRSRQNSAVHSCGNIVDFILDSCCCWHAWRD